MRFAAKYGKYKRGVVSEMSEHYATGATAVIQKGVYAEFTPHGLRPHEREYVLARWSFNGLYQEMDEATTVEPDYRIGVYDSEVDQAVKHWTDDERDLIEQTLLVDDDVLLLPRSSVQPPWPKYDDYRGSVGTLLKKLVEEGHDLETVLTYERESQNRPALVEALEAEINGDSEPANEEIVVA